jgi:hypothetical protein
MSLSSLSQQSLLTKNVRQREVLTSKSSFLMLILIVVISIISLYYFINKTSIDATSRIERSHFLTPSIIRKTESQSTSQFKTPIFTDATIGLLNINSNAKLQYSEARRNEFNKLDLITIPVGSSRVFEAMLDFIPHRLQSSQLTLEDQIRSQKVENSIKVQYFTPQVNGAPIDVYTTLPTTNGRNKDYNVVGKISNSLYRDMSFYYINLSIPSTVDVDLLTNCEPGLILNHESGFFKFSPKKIKIYAGIYTTQPFENTSFHTESIIIAKNISVNTQDGKVKDFYFGTGQLLLDKPETQITEALTRLNTLLSSLRGSVNPKEKPIVCIGIRLTMTNSTQLNTKDKVGELFANHSIGQNFSLAYLPNIHGFWNDYVVSPIQQTTGTASSSITFPPFQKININEMLFYILDAQTERNHFQMITTKVIEKYDLLCALNWSHMYISNPSNYSYRGQVPSAITKPQQQKKSTAKTSLQPSQQSTVEIGAPKLMHEYRNETGRERESLLDTSSVVYPYLDTPVETSESETETVDDDDYDEEEDEYDDKNKYLENLEIPSKILPPPLVPASLKIPTPSNMTNVPVATIEHATKEMGIKEIGIGQQRFRNNK